MIVATTVTVAACSTERQTAQGPSSVDAPATARLDASEPPTTPPSKRPRQVATTGNATTTLRTSTTVGRTTSMSTSSTTAAPPTSTEAPTTTAAPTTTVRPPPAPVPGVHDPACVMQVLAGDSLSSIVDLVAVDGLTVAAVQTENGIADANLIRAGDLLDICAGNEINDIAGGPRLPPPPPAPAGAPTGPVTGSGVEAQQQQLNALFGGYGLNTLPVDGDSGRLTRQQLCAARVALGLPASRSDMTPGSAEEQVLMSARGLPVPAGAPTSAGRWALIDVTCQVMFVGEGATRVVYVFPTSTGSEGFETRRQSGSRVFRFDPALDNGGWHDSVDYPVPSDNPLNGNMYKPLYFDSGQAIHGANNVATDPRSKGCARLRVGDQQTLVDWLGLGDAGGPTYDGGRIGLSVSVQGAY